jgi:hypothetical protein
VADFDGIDDNDEFTAAPGVVTRCLRFTARTLELS